MRQFYNTFTAPEQSQKLLDLGIPAYSADLAFIEEGEYAKLVLASDVGDRKIYLPCWSIGRLIEIYQVGRENTVLFSFCDNAMLRILDDIEQAIKFGSFYFDKFD